MRRSSPAATPRRRRATSCGKLDGCSARPACRATDVRDLLVYVTDDEPGRAAMAECRAAFGPRPAITPVIVSLAMARARVEIMTVAIKP